MMRGEAVYRVGEPKPFTYPPFSALPFVVFAAIPEGLHRAVWYFMNVGMLAIIVRRLSAKHEAPATKLAVEQQGCRIIDAVALRRRCCS